MSRRWGLSRAWPYQRAWQATFVVFGIGLGTVQAQTDADHDSATRPDVRPGLFRLGPLYLTPRFRLGTIGLDTNVFYTPVNRRTDFTASGGPGLELVLPAGRSLRFVIDGGVDYLYFLRTPSQRKLTGDGMAGVERRSPATRLGLAGRYTRTFSRPNFEVDERVLQDSREGRFSGRVLVGRRLETNADAHFVRLETEQGQTFLGADLGRTLTHDTYGGRLDLGYRLTTKTSFLVEGDYVHEQFPLEPTRDSDSNRAGGGFRIESDTLLSGRVVGGVRSFRFSHGNLPDRLVPYAHGDLTYHFGPRTRLGVTYDYDLYYSAFDAVVGPPTLTMQTGQVRLEKGLWGRLDLRLWGVGTLMRSDAPLKVTLAGAPAPQAVVRNDRTGQVGADLGYTFRSRLRFGVAGSYTRRRSPVNDFGVEGLLVGGTITFTPDQPGPR